MYLNICQILDQINPKRLSNLNPRELKLLQFQILEVWSFFSMHSKNELLRYPRAKMFHVFTDYSSEIAISGESMYQPCRLSPIHDHPINLL